MKVWLWLLASFKALLQRIPHASESFLVLSSGRSGSTLLMQYLRCHPSISCRMKEPLNPDTNGLTGPVGSSTLISQVMAQLLSWKRLSGCKIFCEQLEFYRVSFAELLSALRDPPVIVLYRENLLETYVSLQIAFKTDVWYSEKDSRHCTTIKLDFDEYKQYAVTERERWKNTLSALSDKNRVHFFSYEELTADKSKALSGVFMFLNLPPCETVAYSKRQNPFGLAKTISNFEEVKERLDTFSGHILTREWMRGCIL